MILVLSVFAASIVVSLIGWVLIETRQARKLEHAWRDYYGVRGPRRDEGWDGEEAPR